MAEESERPANGHDGGQGSDVARSVERFRARRLRARREGEPTLASQLGQIGVLGWIVVLPTLAGLFVGRWADERLGTGLTLGGALFVAGLVLGCWSAWRWVNRPW